MNQPDDSVTTIIEPSRKQSRKKFLINAGRFSLLSVVAVTAACKKISSNDGLDLGSGDIGILNYAYAL